MIRMWKDPEALIAWLNKRSLKRMPSGELLDLLKFVDQRVDHFAGRVGCHEKYEAWMQPWWMLVEAVDPAGVLAWPGPDWSLVEPKSNCSRSLTCSEQMELFE